MRKEIIAFLLLAISTNLLAQQYHDAGRNVQFGIKITPAIAWLNVVHNDMTAEGATMKFGIGAVANYPITSYLSLVSGINYHGLGGYVFDNKSLSYVDTLGSYKINYKEIEIPIALKLQTVPFRKTSYFLQGGFSVGFITTADEKYTLKAANSEPHYNDINIYTNPTRVSYQLGAGMEYSIGWRSTVFALISFSNAITNIANTDNYTSTIAPNPAPRYNSRIEILPGKLEFSVGVMF